MLVQKDGIKPYTKITSSVQQKKRHNFDNLKIPLQHQGFFTSQNYGVIIRLICQQLLKHT